MAPVTIPRRCDRRCGDPERGTGDVLGLVLVAPLIVAVALVVVLVGRRVDVTSSVRSAAAAGAQAAALERTAVSAGHAGRVVASRMLDNTPTCGAVRVEVDTTAFAPGGSVTVVAGCAVSVRGVQPVVASGEWLVSTAVADIDPYRAVRR
jgi:Flp pilus assembly protein TadG